MRFLLESEENWKNHVAFYLMLKTGPQPNLTLMKYAKQHRFEPQLFMQKVREFKNEVEKEINSGQLELTALAQAMGETLPGTKKAKVVRTAPRQDRSKRTGTPREQIFAILKDVGAELISQKKHYRYKLPNGKQITFPKTPSDQRADLNTLATLRRLLAECLTSPQRRLILEFIIVFENILRMSGPARLRI